MRFQRIWGTSVPGKGGTARMKSRPGHLRSSMERSAEDSERGRGPGTVVRVGRLEAPRLRGWSWL